MHRGSPGGRESRICSVVSAGEDNKYGHPDKSIVKLLEKHTREAVYITYEHGSILFESDGKTITNVVLDAGQDENGKKEEVKSVATAFGSRAPVLRFSKRHVERGCDSRQHIPVRATVSHGGRESESKMTWRLIRDSPPGNL